MQIRSVSTFNSAGTPHLSALVADPGHQIAASPEIAAALGANTHATLAMPNGLVLHALSTVSAAAPQPLAVKDVLDVTGHVAKVGALTLDFAKSQLAVPGLQLNGAIEGVEVALLGIAAAKAWTEAGEQGYTRAVLTTTSAGLELLKLVKDLIPGLERIGPALAVVSFLVKVGDEVCQVDVDMRAKAGHA